MQQLRCWQCELTIEVGRAATVRLHVHSPLLRVKLEQFECSLLAQLLRHIDELVASIVASVWIAFRVLVLHHTAQCGQYGGGGEVL